MWILHFHGDFHTAETMIRKNYFVGSIRFAREKDEASNKFLIFITDN